MISGSLLTHFTFIIDSISKSIYFLISIKFRKVKGYLCPVIGNVCMDSTIVKIPMESDIQEGDIVTLFGYIEDEEEHLNHKEFLTKSGAPIGETFSRLGQRISRICHL